MGDVHRGTWGRKGGKCRGNGGNLLPTGWTWFLSEFLRCFPAAQNSAKREIRDSAIPEFVFQPTFPLPIMLASGPAYIENFGLGKFGEICLSECYPITTIRFWWPGCCSFILGSSRPLRQVMYGREE